MRTQILIATALLLAATSAHAASRSLSGAQTNPVEPPAQKVQILEAPAPKVQVLEAPQAVEPLGNAQAVEPSNTQLNAAGQAPPTAPASAAAAGDKSVATKPVEAAPVAAAPTEASPAPDARPAKQARRKSSRRHATTEQQIERELRAIGRTIERHIGFALSNAALYYDW